MKHEYDLWHTVKGVKEKAPSEKQRAASMGTSNIKSHGVLYCNMQRESSLDEEVDFHPTSHYYQPRIGFWAGHVKM